MGGGLKALQPKVTADGILLQQLNPMRNRLIYMFFLPHHKNRTSLTLHYRHQVKEVTAYFPENLLPTKGFDRLKAVVRGKGQLQSRYMMLRLEPGTPKHPLTLTLASKHGTGSRGVSGWLKRAQKHSKNKLAGIIILVLISVFGLILLGKKR